MENIIKLFIRTLTGIFILSSISCGEESALKEETIYFQKENKNWITADSIGCNFILQDNNGISHSFTMLRDFYEFSKSWGSFLGIKHSYDTYRIPLPKLFFKLWNSVFLVVNGRI
jgi:hypothetical protein